MSQRQHRDEKHMYRWKKKRNRIPKWKKISCLTCQSLFHFSRAMFSLDNEPVNVRVFLFANNLSPDSKASSLPRVKTSFSHRNIVEVDRILNEQRDFMLFRARKARCVDERLDSGSVAQRSGLRESYDWVDLRCLYASENRGKISRGKIRRKMSSVGRASGNFGVGHPKFQPGTFVPGSRFANRASLDANRAMCPVCPVLEWPLSLASLALWRRDRRSPWWSWEMCDFDVTSSCDVISPDHFVRGFYNSSFRRCRPNFLVLQMEYKILVHILSIYKKLEQSTN